MNVNTRPLAAIIPLGGTGMHFVSTSRPCRDTPGAGELRHHLMRQVGAKSRGLGDVARPNYVPAALLRGSERLGTVTRHHQWVEGTLRRPERGSRSGY